jgi:hypothetical protein
MGFSVQSAEAQVVYDPYCCPPPPPCYCYPYAPYYVQPRVQIRVVPRVIVPRVIAPRIYVPPRVIVYPRRYWW